MSKKRKRTRPQARAEPKTKSSVVFAAQSGWDDLLCGGYTSLSQNPEIVAAVDTIARLISSMTIHLMENTSDGDVRIRDELARRLDIEPNRYMTRANFIYWIVKTLYLDGHGNAVVYPETKNGYLDNLVPIPPSSVSFVPDGWGYKVVVSGRELDPSEVLHFALNPGSDYPWRGEGFQVSLADVAANLRQAATTKKGFMASKWKPSVIVKVDGLIDEFASPAGRQKLIDSYLDTQEPGAPWIIPAEQFSVEQIKPLTLSDLALSDMVTLDKKTVASILGVPPYILGVGGFNREEWNNFINSKIMATVRILEQEFTKKLLYSPNRFWRFSARSLYSYDIKDMSAVAREYYSSGLMIGNEARDWVGLPPLPGLDKLVILENYIPADRIGEQEKLIGGDKS